MARELDYDQADSYLAELHKNEIMIDADEEYISNQILDVSSQFNAYQFTYPYFSLILVLTDQSYSQILRSRCPVQIIIQGNNLLKLNIFARDPALRAEP